MGIRGLTAFISNNPEKHHGNYQLHDCYLVIDGNNIACHLYKWHCTRNDCFGGDYDKFSVVVQQFFDILKMCNVVPLIIFDGGYENRKLKTVYKRMKSKITEGKFLNSCNQSNGTYFPLFVKEVFTDLAIKLNLKCVRTEFEADCEMACLAQNLSCPLLSYDSDFYVFDVLYLPFNNFPLTVSKLKSSTTTSSKHCIKCKFFKVDNFLKSVGGLQKSNLPLLATLLGNDYIKRSYFRAFYSALKITHSKGSKNLQQKKIASVIDWLKNESCETAIQKILARVKKKYMKSVQEKIEFIIDGYKCKESKLISFFDLNEYDVTKADYQGCSAGGALNLEEIASIYEEEIENVNSNFESDTSSSSDDDLDVVELKDFSKLPRWFVDRYRKFCYPSMFVDIISRNTIFCTPQIENYDLDCSHHISFPILSAIHKVLTSGNLNEFFCVTRGKNIYIRKNIIPSSELSLPTLEGLKNAPKNCTKYITDVLELEVNKVEEMLKDIPDSWKLFFLSVIYWAKKLSEDVTYCHIYSIVLCTIVLNCVDPHIGFYRSTSKFIKMLDKTAPDHRQTIIKEEDFNGQKIFMFLNSITKKEMLIFMKSMIPYFQMDAKMATYSKLYEIEVVDAFARLQSVSLYVKHLNALFNFPFKDLIISNFFDGTFLYSMTVNFLQRNDIKMYLEILLKNCPNVYKAVLILSEIIFKMVNCDLKNNNKHKKKRKRKQKKKDSSISVETDQIEYDFVDTETFVDVNNKFTFLQIE